MFGRETYQAAWARLEENVGYVETEGKVPWISDHAASCIRKEVILSWLREGKCIEEGGNPTVFTASFMESLSPILLIRHPALAVPSWYRKQKPLLCQTLHDEDFKVCTTLAWSRMVFEYCQHLASQRNAALPAETEQDAAEDHSHRIPIVVDAEDVVYNTRSTMETLCSLLHLDPAGVQYSWDPVPDEEIPDYPMRRAFFLDIMKSTGVQHRTEDAAEQHINLDTETARWTAEFGVEDAQALREIVEAELPNYKYLRQYKLSV
ncbi:hypothetical protein LTR36_002985 [Oleoguttula mirabilis]|uniref:Uncharacterized protein n=1 Tax=Oleoguttula mirabilis TaxID=1507867 RepID=A0AAV9JWM3_9PEZI|nr:hypothetical protein LTR36_002985 [Oleoguttula mirabilis]